MWSVVLHLSRGWRRDQRGSQSTTAAGAALAAALIAVAVSMGAIDYLAPAVERAMRCAAAVLVGGEAGCTPEEQAALDTPEAIAEAYLATVNALLDRARRSDITHAELEAALRSMPPLTPDGEAALFDLLERRYHAADLRPLTETDLYRQYQQYPATTTLGHVAATALAFERYVDSPFQYEGHAVQTYAHIWSEYAHNQLLSMAVSGVYVAELDRLDSLAMQRPLTDAEVLMRQDMIARLEGFAATDGPTMAPSLTGGVYESGALLGGAVAGPLRAADDDAGGTNSGHVPVPQRTLFENKMPEHEIAPPRQMFTPQQIRQPYFSKRLNYVVKENGTLVLGRQQDAPGGGHIDLAQGAPVLAAGEVRVVNGTIIYVDNSSGHYLPNGLSAQAAAESAFKGVGFDSIPYVEKVWNGSAWVPK